MRKRGRDITTRCLGGRRVPHLHERGGGRLREIEARKLGVVEGGVSYRCNRGRDHKRALKVGVREGAVPNLHERGRLREVEARELGAVEGGLADRLVSLVGITSVLSRSVPQKAHSQISTSEAAPPTGRGW